MNAMHIFAAAVGDDLPALVGTPHSSAAGAAVPVTSAATTPVFRRPAALLEGGFMKNRASRLARSAFAFRRAPGHLPPRKFLACVVAPLLAAGVALIAAAGPAPAATHSRATAAAGGQTSTQVVVSAEHTSDGYVLATGSGLPLYSFSGQDLSALFGTSTVGCTAQDGCLAIWPALLVPAGTSAVAEDGALQSKLGTAPYSATEDQVTYAGHRLYTFIRDSAGVASGEDATAFNGFFRLLFPSGAIDGGMSTVALELSANGPVLAFRHGTTERTLYLLTYDPPHQATCTGPCAEIWPTLVSSTPAVAGTGVSPHLLGRIRLADGSFQVTYNGHPLYLFFADLARGAASGLTLGEYFDDTAAHGVWYTVSPTGNPDPGLATVQSESATISGQPTQILAFKSGFTGSVFTLYGFSSDTPATSACTGSCARFWPPLLTSEPPQAGAGVSQGELGAIQRPDGTFQVTYNGHPLYLFVADQPGTTNGEGIHAFGGTFDVISTTGTPLG
jgi:predicted lipoprotein with Yx(FWY)xxD motif